MGLSCRPSWRQVSTSKSSSRGSGAAGQGDDGVGVHEHHLLALVHGLGDDEAAEVAPALLAGDEVHGLSLIHI